MMTIKNFLLVLACLAVSGTASAQLQIDITKGVEGGLPIAIVPFEWRGQAAQPSQVVSDIIESDLAGSGRFEAIPRQNHLSRPFTHEQVNFKDWRLVKAEALVIGQVHQTGPDSFRVQFQLFDVFRGIQLAGFRYTVKEDQLRKAAHQISDIIFEKLTGIPGAFDTRIAYVTVTRGDDGERYLLNVADADGYGPRSILTSSEPILSVTWSPDSSQLAYVSFENRQATIYVQRLSDGQRSKLAQYPGLNSAPAWSPDGRKIAMSLSRDGNPEIYVYDFASRGLNRITRDLGIDTEPSWSPDGRFIAFTSDRSGKPQIYQVPSGGGQAQRLTFEGKYNAKASYAPDGKTMALVTNQGNGYRVGLLFLNNRSIVELTGNRLDESPSFAPNGAMILYATERGGRGVLAAVSSDGRVEQQLGFQKGDVREPAWSPFNRKL